MSGEEAATTALAWPDPATVASCYDAAAAHDHSGALALPLPAVLQAAAACWPGQPVPRAALLRAFRAVAGASDAGAATGVDRDNFVELLHHVRTLPTPHTPTPPRNSRLSTGGGQPGGADGAGGRVGGVALRRLGRRLPPHPPAVRRRHRRPRLRRRHVPRRAPHIAAGEMRSGLRRDALPRRRARPTRRSRDVARAPAAPAWSRRPRAPARPTARTRSHSISPS